ncbi:uncharacterized protein LOC106164960 [Lingula anatina]|uniref:Uncharacterized protein LOC106164960 n=1 Tax=Lingula anatina TaxID=7574 RepID=A0A1S3IKQ6_LINAN|nr:uncharacterized protein LOC106164960 [Lingula anatina]|eukprot:XP_013398471.1 uncharacterized protein LOC106164960 [Lingula anatina]
MQLYTVFVVACLFFTVTGLEHTETEASCEDDSSAEELPDSTCKGNTVAEKDKIKEATARSGIEKYLVNCSSDPRLTYTVDVGNFQDTDTPDTDEIVKELTEGLGYFVLRQVFSKEDIAHAREVIHYLIKNEGKRATHFHGSEDSTQELQARTWNLLNKGKIFEKMTQHPKVVSILYPILGDDMQLGSIAANTLFPGASGQEPHIDYPYWDYFERKHWPVAPKVPEVPFHMNMQATVLLDDFTAENGATGVVPGSQVRCVYPDSKEFYEKYVQVIGKAGDVVLFPGLIQHAAMPNKSKASRSAILLQYLPKYIRPMEDIKRSVHPDILKRASPCLRRLLTMDYPYPALLDEAEPGNSEGSKSDFSWKTYDTTT